MRMFNLPPHLSRIAADEARKKNAERALKSRRLAAVNVRKSPLQMHQARFVAWLWK